MSEFFLSVVNMSIAASWIVLAVIVLRMLLKKAPRWITVILWGIVAIRLILPFTVESVLSLIPSAQTVSPEIMTNATPEIHTGIPLLNSAVNPMIVVSVSPDPTQSANPLQVWIPVLSVVWLLGMVALLAYTVVSYLRVKKNVGTAVLLRDNIYQSETVVSLFVLGVVRPKIYLPFNENEQEMDHVIAHEQAHIRRKDHWWKPIGFFVLTLHWFNPVMWLAYVLLCRDIELACDEKVVKEFDAAQKAEYSQALLDCSVNRRRIAACPLAFGEVGVKNRVRSVLNYKKPTFWIVAVGVLLSVAAGVCFLTNPISDTLGTIEFHNFGSVTAEQTAVFVTNGEANWYVGAVDKSLLQELYNIRISKKEISQNRREDRDKTHTLGLNLPGGNQQLLVYSYTPQTEICFNADFTQVWVNDDVKPTLSYAVKYPEKAKAIYERIADLTVTRDFETRVSYANWSEAPEFYANAQNAIWLEGPSEHFPIYKFETSEELASFKEMYKTTFTMDRGWDEVPSFNEVTARYTPEFFKENNLLLVYVGSGSCTYRFAVDRLEYNDTYFRVYIKETTNAEVLQMAMAGWFITVDVPKESIASCNTYDAVLLPDTEPISETVTEAQIKRLREEYPAYFDLSAAKGLEVYVWQMAGDHYSCGLLPGKNLGYTQEEIWELQKTPATLKEMQTIVSYYIANGIVTKDEVAVLPCIMPHSSFAHEAIVEYAVKLKTMFWADIPVIETE